MANGTPLSQCLVLVDKRAALSGVAFEASLVSTQESQAAGFESLLNVGATAFDRNSLMRVVTIGAAHLAFRHRMMVRQLKLRPHFQVTLKASLRRFSWIYDRASSAAGFDMQTPWPVARLAAHVLGVLAFCLQSRVRRCFEIAHDLFVAGGAFLRADELRTWNAWWRKNCSISRAARKQNHGQRDCSSGTPQQTFALTEDPPS